MTEVSEWCSATQQQQKLLLHSRKRRSSSVDNRNQKSRAVSLTWSAPLSVVCTWRGLRESGNGTQPSHAYEHKQNHPHKGIHAQHLSLPSSVPVGFHLAVEPPTAELRNAAINPTQLSRNQGTAPKQESRKTRAVDLPACQDSGMSNSAVQAKASCAASAPARLPFANWQPNVLASAPVRRHRSADKMPAGIQGQQLLAPPEQECQRLQACSQPGFAEDNISHAISKQQVGIAGGTKALPGRTRSAVGSAASSSSTGSAANATQALMQMWTNPMQPPAQSCLPTLEGVACGNITGLRPQTITKAQLDTARPLQQVSRQFVPLVCGRTVAIMDQHAAAERVRLEQLQHEVIGEDGYPKQGDSVRLQPAQLLELSPAELQLLQHHRTHLEAWGWRFAHTRSSNGSGALVTHAAAVLGTALNSTELQSFLQQLRQTNGVARVPQAVHRLLVSKACHSAIRFGDVLSGEQCEQLLQALRKTVCWHCCAHGRPTIVPLVDLAHLRSLLHMRGEER